MQTTTLTSRLREFTDEHRNACVGIKRPDGSLEIQLFRYDFIRLMAIGFDLFRWFVTKGSTARRRQVARLPDCGFASDQLTLSRLLVPQATAAVRYKNDRGSYLQRWNLAPTTAMRETKGRERLALANALKQAGHPGIDFTLGGDYAAAVHDYMAWPPKADQWKPERCHPATEPILREINMLAPAVR